MATRLKSLKRLDHRKLLKECDEEQSFAHRCLRVFARETRADLEGIASALDSRDFLEIARLAHRIKGASASIRAEFMRERAASLERSAVSGTWVNVGYFYRKLKTEFESFNRYIATLPLGPD